MNEISKQLIQLIISVIGLTIIEVFTVISVYPISKVLALFCTGIYLSVIGVIFRRVAVGVLIAIAGILIILLSNLYIAYTVSSACLWIFIRVYLILLAIAI